MTESGKIETFQQLILHISTDFINLSPQKLDPTIDHTLKLIGEFTGSDRSYIFLLNRVENSISNSHEWCADDIKPQIDTLQGISLKTNPWFREHLLTSEPVIIPDVRKMPETAAREKEHLLNQDIQSLIVVPMIYSGSQVGFIGFDSVRQKRQWTEDEVNLLMVVADIVANAIIQRSVVTKLHESEEQYRLLVENLNDGIVISQNDKFTFMNKRFCEMLGYRYEELIMADYRYVYTDEGLSILQERARRREAGEEVPSRYETVFKKKDGSRLNVEANVRIINYQGAPATFGIISDITERKETEKYQRKLEVELLKRQKMANMGLFAGGIVHNMRNTLTVIIGRAQLLKEKMPDLKEPDIIISSANKIVQIADNFLKKTQRESVEQSTSIDLNDLIRTEVTFTEFNQYVKKRIDIHLDFSPDIPLITGHYIDYSHALSGIIEYSINAMESTDIRKLTIQTRMDENVIVLSIVHTGDVLSDEEMNSIFTPFYSIKKYTHKRDAESEYLKTMQIFNAYILLDRYNVKFKMEKDINQHTRFLITIPVNK